MLIVKNILDALICEHKVYENSLSFQIQINRNCHRRQRVPFAGNALNNAKQQK